MKTLTAAALAVCIAMPASAQWAGQYLSDQHARSSHDTKQWTKRGLEDCLRSAATWRDRTNFGLQLYGSFDSPQVSNDSAYMVQQCYNIWRD